MHKERTQKRSLYIKLTLLLAGTIVLFLLVNMGQVILPFIFAALLAYFLQPLADFLLKHRIPLILSVVLVYLVFILLLYLLIFLGLPKLFEELSKIAADIPYFLEKAGGLLDRLPLPQDFLKRIGEMIEFPPQGFEAANFAGWLKSIAQFFFALLLAPLLSYYILKDREKMKRGILSLLPLAERDEISRIASDVNRIYRSFFSGYVLLALIVAILSFIMYTLLRIRYAVVLALFLGVCDLIPYFGPFIGAVPTVLIAFMQSPLYALYVVIGVFIIQQLESSVFSPKILGSRIGLNPLTVIFSVLFGGFYFGLFGLIFAVPTAAALKLIISYIYCRISRAKA